MAFTKVNAAGITSTSTVVLQNATVAGVLTATSGFVGNLTGSVTGAVTGNGLAFTISGTTLTYAGGGGAGTNGGSAGSGGISRVKTGVRNKYRDIIKIEVIV
jgi:hypothetical protein